MPSVREQLQTANAGHVVKIVVTGNARSKTLQVGMAMYRQGKTLKHGLGVHVTPETDLTTWEPWAQVQRARELAESAYFLDPNGFSFAIAAPAETPPRAQRNLYDLMREFYAAYYTNDLSAKSHKWAVNVFEGYLGKNPPELSRITKEHIRGFRAYLLKQYPDQNTAAKFMGYVNKFFNQMSKDDVIQASPAVGVNIKKLDKPIVYLEDGEVATLAGVTLEQVKAWASDPKSKWPSSDTKALGFTRNLEVKTWQQVRRAWAADLELGLRITDLRALRFCDFSKGKGQIFTRKTGKVVPLALSETAAAIIAEIMAERPDHRPNDLIFELPRSVDVSRVLTAWAKTAGLKKSLTFRTARRTLASRVVTHVHDIYAAKNILGHGSVKTTEKYYAKLGFDSVRAAVDSLPKTGF